MDKEKLQKEIVDAISQIAKNESSKYSQVKIVKGEIVSVDPLGCYYNFSYNNHIYSARSTVGGYSIGQKAFIIFNGSQENNIILCGEIIGSGTLEKYENRQKVISSIVQQYYISNSSEIEPPEEPGETSSYKWFDIKIEPTEKDPFLWTRYKYIFTDASIIYSTPYLLNLSTDLVNFKNEYYNYKESNDKKWEDNSENIKNLEDNFSTNEDKISGLEDDLKNNYYTKTETDGEIKDAKNDLYLDIEENYPKIEDVQKNIISLEEQFYLSDSPTDLNGGVWTSIPPKWEEGKYIWKRNYITYFNGTTSYIPNENGVCITGNNGPAGPQGETGPQGEKGEQGNPGTSIRLRNEWSSNAVSYINNATYIDIVTYNGSSYACKLSHTSSASITPINNNYWMLIASKGSVGETGKKGDTGPQGPAGPQGERGLVPVFTVDKNGDLYVNYEQDIEQNIEVIVRTKEKAIFTE